MSRTLIIATWSGDRHWHHPKQESDRGYYVRQQVKQLEMLRHSITDIVFVVPYNEEEPPSFKRAIESLNDKIVNTRVCVLRRENAGMSYGSWLHAMRKITKSNWYFLLEDDYIFTQNEFDDRLIEMITDRPKCGYLCGKIQKYRNVNENLVGKESRSIIASVSCGLVHGRAARKIVKYLSHLDWVTKRALSRNNCLSQIAFSALFNGDGRHRCWRAPPWKIKDVRDQYSVVFRNYDGTTDRFHGQQPIIMAPIGGESCIDSPCE